MRRRDTQTQTQPQLQTQPTTPRAAQTRSQGNWFTRLFAGWWRIRLHWKVFKIIVSAVRSLFTRRTPAYRR